MFISVSDIESFLDRIYEEKAALLISKNSDFRSSLSAAIRRVTDQKGVNHLTSSQEIEVLLLCLVYVSQNQTLDEITSFLDLEKDDKDMALREYMSSRIINPVALFGSDRVIID